MRVMMSETYSCDYCGKPFLSKAECRNHEQTHIKDYAKAETEEIVAELYNLAENGTEYHSFGRVAGIPCESFESLLKTAAKRLEETENGL